MPGVLHGEGERLGAEVAALEAALREKETALAVLSVRPPHPTVPVADVPQGGLGGRPRGVQRTTS